MTNQNAKGGPVLVIGGQGKTGKRVAERLEARKISVRLGSRSSAIAFDWERTETWRAALAGVSAAYVTFFPDLALPGAAETVEKLAMLAREMGVERLVLLSGRGEEGAQHAERLFLAAQPKATILRANWFSQNFSESYLLDGVLAGEIALPAGDIGEPFIDAEDIADVAVAALTESGHEGETYVLSGPRALTFAEATQEISRVTGRAISYRRIPLADFLVGLKAQGAPDDVAQLLEFLFGEILDGRNTPIADGVTRALKRKPTSFEDYARRAAASGVWNVA